jgi:hypothetical protein
MCQNGHQIPCSQNGRVLLLAVHLHIESGVLCNWDWPHVWNVVLWGTSYGEQLVVWDTAFRLVYCSFILDAVFANSNVRPSILVEQ